MQRDLTHAFMHAHSTGILCLLFFVCGCVSQGGEVVELFATGSAVPSSTTRHFSRKSTGSGLAVDMEVVQWVEGDGGGGGGKSGSKKGSSSSSSTKGRWTTVQRLGNPLALQDDG